MTQKTKVYAFHDGNFGREDQVWFAVAETGVVVTSHVSSSRSWGIHDVSPDWKRAAYASAVGEDFDVELIVLDDGQFPPDEVLERNKALAAEVVDSE